MVTNTGKSRIKFVIIILLNKKGVKGQPTQPRLLSIENLIYWTPRFLIQDSAMQGAKTWRKLFSVGGGKAVL